MARYLFGHVRYSTSSRKSFFDNDTKNRIISLNDIFDGHLDNVVTRRHVDVVRQLFSSSFVETTTVNHVPNFIYIDCLEPWTDSRLQKDPTVPGFVPWLNLKKALFLGETLLVPK